MRAHVNAEAQAAHHDALLAAPGRLEEKERALLAWAAAHPGVRPRARFEGPTAEAAYRKATALEALVRVVAPAFLLCCLARCAALRRCGLTEPP